MKIRIKSFVLAYLLVFGGCVTLAAFGSRAATAMSVDAHYQKRRCVVIDAGHGGIDGGAVSCTGVYESQINLQIAERLNDLLRLLGIQTKMLREQDVSLHTQGDSIGQKKVSDLKNRVLAVNETENGFLISIHQNYFSQSRYFGPQVFYAKGEGSQEFANALQAQLLTALTPSVNRQAKPAQGVYLMEHIQKPGVLIECGFLSNPAEEAKLREGEYQKKLAAVIAVTVSSFLS